jgi:hypothetical protein
VYKVFSYFKREADAVSISLSLCATPSFVSVTISLCRFILNAKYLRAWMTVTNKHVGGRGRLQRDIIYGEITQSFLFLSDVKLLRLGCRSNTCGLRRVSALLVFYRSYGSQNTVQCSSQCIKMPPIVSKLKGEKMFSVSLYMLRQTLCRLALSTFSSPLTVT